MRRSIEAVCRSQVFGEVLAVRPSRSRPKRVTVRGETRNQHGHVMQSPTARRVARRRHA